MGDIPKEKRGGDHISQKSTSKKQNVRNFLNNLPAKESHYNRAKSCRIYMSAELSIKKLHKIYQHQSPQENQVALSMFRRIFLNEFNIGFSSPASDVCAQCTRLKSMIKDKGTEEKKNELRAELTIHKKRANAFYDHLKEKNPHNVTFCFDLQQVQPLPRTNINDAFYAHQISFYCFCCVGGDSRNPIFYTWTENEAGRGSTEVASALINYLDSLTYNGISTVRLFCDGCAGQNKNSHIVHALYFWMRFKAPIGVTEIQLIFPVRGHSFLPADRAFGRVEKLLRKHPTLISAQDYKNIYEKVGKVRELGIDWRLFEVKDFLHTLKKVKGISSVKKIFLRRFANGTNIKMCCFPNYRFVTGQEKFETLLKPGRVHLDLSFTELSLDRGIPEKKKKSLRQLMVQQFGQNWEDVQRLQWYKTLLNDLRVGEAIQQNNGDEMCDCLDEEQSVFI